MTFSPRARGFLFVLKGPYDPRIPPIVKFSQESESARLTKIILSKSTVKTLLTLVPSKSQTAILNIAYEVIFAKIVVIFYSNNFLIIYYPHI